MKAQRDVTMNWRSSIRLRGGVVRLWLLSLVALGLASGCGNVKVKEVTEEADSQSGADGLGADSAGDISADVASDTVAADVKAECETDFDCYAIVTGKTPCSLPVCQAGQCVKKNKPVGTNCNDPSLSPTECQKASCNDTGVCALADLAEGTSCGLGVCGNKCAVGLCVPASATDYDDSNPCTKDYCNQGFEVRHDPITDLTELCDDGDACTSGDSCVLGKCKGQALSCNDGIACTNDSCDPGKGCLATPKDDLCDDGDPCTKQACDPALGCKQAGFVAGAACDDGNACTAGEKCSDAGECKGESTCSCSVDSDCKQENLCLGPVSCQAGKCVTDASKEVLCDGSGDTACLKNVCAPATGQCQPQPQLEGKGCDDGNACTSVSTCLSGACTGAADKKCDDSNACTTDACSPQSGCVFAPNSTACDDGNPCTSTDTCDKGGCVGTPKACDDGIACTLDSCDSTTGNCTPKATNQACSDGNDCTADSCDVKKGCVNAPADGAACEDGDACTTGDKCAAGKCAGTNTCQCKTGADCNDNNPCTVDKCEAGKCVADSAGANGTACDSSDKCQKPGTGKCSAGTCAATNQPIVCTATNACQNAACNPSSGKCESVNKPDGSSCDADKDGCTVADKCATGQCVAGAKAQCANANACSVGTCKSDTAQPSGYVCNQTALAAGTACEDGQYCTTGDKCDSAGKCAAGAAISCAAQTDACNTGTCDEAKDQCVKTPKANTIACDDAQFCTISDHCDGAGKCVTGGAKTCTGGNCQTGVCDEVGDKCATKPAAAGAACTDGSVCTQTDTCDSVGACKGSGAVVCNDNNPCTTDSCDAVKGCVYTPAAGIACEDGNNCTGPDKCDAAGKCQAGPVTCQCQTNANCDDANACTTDTCTANKCVNTVTNGATCDDKNPCSLASTCNSTGACVADTTKMFDCSTQNDTCNTGVCYVGTTGAAACKKQPKAKGVSCDDTLFCTTADTCDGVGKCIGGVAPTCPKPAQCFAAVCTEAAKGCTTQALAQGSLCTDNNSCTNGDACNGTGSCTPGAAVPDFGACDDGIPYTSADFCYATQCAGFTMQKAGPTSGPIGRISYQSGAKTWTATANNAGALDEFTLGGWGIYGAKTLPTAPEQTWAATLTGAPGTVHAAADQVMVGYGNAIWVQSAGTTSWKINTALHTAVKAVVTSALEWDSVATYASGTTLYVALTGHLPNDGTNYLVRCSGDNAFAGVWSCKAATLSGSYRNVGSSVWYSTTCIGCAAVFNHSVAGIVRSGPTTGTALNELTNSFSSTAGYVVTSGPTFSSTTSMFLADNWHANFVLKNLTGSTSQWLVGPLGTVAYSKVGTAGIFAAAVTKGVQSSYNFRNVDRSGANVLISGTKPDPINTSNRLPVLMVHADAADQQSGTAYWNEFVLAAPPFNELNCLSNGVTSAQMAVAAGGLMVWVNSCDNPLISKAVTARRGWIYYRPFTTGGGLPAQ
jgi:hypothetical protein